MGLRPATIIVLYPNGHELLHAHDVALSFSTLSLAPRPGYAADNNVVAMIFRRLRDNELTILPGDLFDGFDALEDL